MNEECQSHTKWDSTYHIVFIPKYRRKVMYGECGLEIREIIKRLADLKKLEVVGGAVCMDYIHISLRIPPKYSVAEIMGYLKGKRAMMLFDRHPEWRRKNWSRENILGKRILREYDRT